MKIVTDELFSISLELCWIVSASYLISLNFGSKNKTKPSNNHSYSIKFTSLQLKIEH